MAPGDALCPAALSMRLPQPQDERPARRTEADDSTPIEDELEDSEHEGRGCARLSQQRHSEQAPADSNAVAHQRHQASEEAEPHCWPPNREEARSPERQR